MNRKPYPDGSRPVRVFHFGGVPMSRIFLYGASFPPETDGRAAARALLSFALGGAWGWTETPPIERERFGKPRFPDFPDRQFSLSHTAGLCLCALSETGAVGADIERVRPRRASLPRYALSDRELAAFDGTWEDFTRLWTLKEAYVKLRGGSIFPPRDVPAPPPVPWRCYTGEGWRAALCAEGGELPEEIRWVEL